MKLIRINEKDNAALCVTDIRAGEELTADGIKIVSAEDIPAGHKIALCDIPAGEKVIKYGNPIGHAARDIKKGEHIHTHDLESDLVGLEDYVYSPKSYPLPEAEPFGFSGYLRKNGEAGVRNEIWIIPTVGCSVPVAREIQRRSEAYAADGVDGIFCYSHSYGCSQLGDDMKNTLKLLADLCRHPNAGGVLVVGLGCENGNIGELKKYLGEFDPDRIRFLEAQSEGDEIARGAELVKELCIAASKDKRTPLGCEKLRIGLKCGGSDGFSGVTANPVIGAFTDMLVASGGSAVLTEVPEMFGAERILMDRCASREVFERTVGLINGFREYFMSYGEKIGENPSPGNKAGGITTLEEKSLGCIQKGGFSPVTDVLDYADRVRVPGLSLLQAPGNDLVSSTALAAAGCQIVLFATGRGTPFSCPAPTLKISSNTPLYEKKKSWIDFDAGRLLTGISRAALAAELRDLVIDVASGKRLKGEALDKSELAIFKNGVTL